MNHGIVRSRDNEKAINVNYTYMCVSCVQRERERNLFLGAIVRKRSIDDDTYIIIVIIEPLRQRVLLWINRNLKSHILQVRTQVHTRASTLLLSLLLAPTVLTGGTLISFSNCRVSTNDCNTVVRAWHVCVYVEVEILRSLYYTFWFW